MSASISEQSQALVDSVQRVEAHPAFFVCVLCHVEEPLIAKKIEPGFGLRVRLME